MAQVCIHTNQGMVCDSSPLRECAGNGRFKPLSEQRSKRLRGFRFDVSTKSGLSAQHRKVIGRVVRLMVAMGVSERSTFTIVKAKA